VTPRPRLSYGTRRRLDRLAERAHAFHRFAHHPLCARYAGELMTLGRRNRICRGCAALAAGGVTGVLAAPWLAANTELAWAALAFGILSGALSLGVRLPKLAGRFMPAFSLAFAGVRGLALGTYAPLLVALATVLVLFLAYRRRRPDRSPCQSCPERLAPAPCSGFAAIVRRERAFRRVAQRLIDSELTA
jgi:hypothetical protein